MNAMTNDFVVDHVADWTTEAPVATLFRKTAPVEFALPDVAETGRTSLSVRGATWVAITLGTAAFWVGMAQAVAAIL